MLADGSTLHFPTQLRYGLELQTDTLHNADTPSIWLDLPEHRQYMVQSFLRHWVVIDKAWADGHNVNVLWLQLHAISCDHIVQHGLACAVRQECCEPSPDDKIRVSMASGNVHDLLLFTLLNQREEGVCHIDSAHNVGFDRLVHRIDEYLQAVRFGQLAWERPCMCCVEICAIVDQDVETSTGDGRHGSSSFLKLRKGVEVALYDVYIRPLCRELRERWRRLGITDQSEYYVGPARRKLTHELQLWTINSAGWKEGHKERTPRPREAPVIAQDTIAGATIVK